MEFIQAKNIKLTGISWVKIKEALHTGKVYELLISHAKRDHNIKVINCLRPQYSFSQEKNLNDEILGALNMLNKNYQYIFFSTFEPSQKSTTRYRLYKYKIEKHLSGCKNCKIIRIGRIVNLPNQRDKIKENITVCFANMSGNVVRLPFTRSEELLSKILESKNIKQEPIKLYSGYERLCIRVLPQKPYLALDFRKIAAEKKPINYSSPTTRAIVQLM